MPGRLAAGAAALAARRRAPDGDATAARRALAGGPRSLVLRLAASTALLFAVHAVPAGDALVGAAVVPLAGPEGPGAAQRVLVALPGGMADVGLRDGARVLELAEGDGLRRCRLILRLRAEASARGVRSDPPTLVFGFGGERRTIRTGPEVRAGGRRTWTGDLRRLRVGGPPVPGLARFSTPPGRGLPPATVVLAEAEAALDTSSPVQRTPEALRACSALVRRQAPAAVRTALGTAEVTSAPRDAP